MSAGRQNEGTPYLRWQLTDEPYKPNVTASRDYLHTVQVSVSTNGVGMRMELTPKQAREFAATVIELADAAEQERKASSEDNAPVIGRGQFEVPTRTRPNKEFRID